LYRVNVDAPDVNLDDRRCWRSLTCAVGRCRYIAQRAQPSEQFLSVTGGQPMPHRIVALGVAYRQDRGHHALG
jgi:hypothetical protein